MDSYFPLISALIAVIPTYLVYLISKRKASAEVESIGADTDMKEAASKKTEAEAVEIAGRLYQDIIKSLREDKADLIQERGELRVEVKALEDKETILRQDLEDLKMEFRQKDAENTRCRDELRVAVEKLAATVYKRKRKSTTGNPQVTEEIKITNCQEAK